MFNILESGIKHFTKILVSIYKHINSHRYSLTRTLTKLLSSLNILSSLLCHTHSLLCHSHSLL